MCCRTHPPPPFLEEPPRLLPSFFPARGAQRALSRPLWLRHKGNLVMHGTDAERSLMRSACGLGGHEWVDAVPSHPAFRVPTVFWLPAFRHYLGLSTFPGPQPPPACACQPAKGTPLWVHQLSCNIRGVSTRKHNALARVWFAYSGLRSIIR